jgi:hypothetical protein
MSDLCNEFFNHCDPKIIDLSNNMHRWTLNSILGICLPNVPRGQTHEKKGVENLREDFEVCRFSSVAS